MIPLMPSVVNSALAASNAARTMAASRSTSIGGQLGSAVNQINRIAGIAGANTALSVAEAARLRDWQVAQNDKAMRFNAAEAAKNRNWQEYMSNTSHQREVRDLQAAGLNPVLSAMGGNGAAVTSGATAAGVTSSGAKGEPDVSSSTAIVHFLSSMLNAQTQLQAQNISALNNLAVADKYTAMSKIVAELQASASRYAADSSRAAARYSSDTSYSIARDFPNTQWSALFSVLRQLFGSGSGTAGKQNNLFGIGSAKDAARSEDDYDWYHHQ